MLYVFRAVQSVLLVFVFVCGRSLLSLKRGGCQGRVMSNVYQQEVREQSVI